MDEVSEARLLGLLAEFDPLGGASLGLVAWELFATEHQLRVAWQRAIDQGWLAPAGYDQVYGERLWRLTASGRAALQAAEGLGRPAE